MSENWKAELESKLVSSTPVVAEELKVQIAFAAGYRSGKRSAMVTAMGSSAAMVAASILVLLVFNPFRDSKLAVAKSDSKTGTELAESNRQRLDPEKISSDFDRSGILSVGNSRSMGMDGGWSIPMLNAQANSAVPTEPEKEPTEILTVRSKFSQIMN